MAYEFQYTSKDGRLVSIKPNESYILIAKTNEHWWHVRKDLNSRPFYVPAQYMNKPSGVTENSVDTTSLTDVTPEKTTTVNRVSVRNSTGEQYRFSTFGLCVPDVDPCEALVKIRTRRGSFAPNPGDLDANSSSTRTSDLNLYAKPLLKVKNRTKSSQHEETQLQVRTFQTQIQTVDDEDEDDSFEFPPPPTPTLFLCDTMPELNCSETISGLSETSSDGSTNKTALDQQQSENQNESAASSGDRPVTEKVWMW